MTNFPDKLRPFFTNLDYFGYPSNVRYAKIKHWKDAENAQIALDLIPQKEMGKAIDYYLKNKPYLAKSLYNYITNSIIDNYLKPNYSNYPQESKEIVDKVLIHKQKQLETLKNKSLLNNNSKDFDEEVEVKKQKKMVFFKLYNGKKVSSDEDCFMIVKAFLEESLTIESFCNKYKISDVSGFRRMLEYVSSISEEYKNKIDNVIQKNQNKFILSTNDFISKILDPNVDIEELIKSNKSKQRDLKTILSFKIPQKDKEMIILKVMSNFHSRLSLDDKSSNVENINRLLSDKELRFIIGYENFEKLNRGEVVNLDDCINDLIIPYRSSLDKQSDGGFGKQCLSPIKKLVVKYSTRFSGKKYLKSEPGLGDKNGEVVKISPEMVDMAVHYAKVNKLYLSHYTIEKILKAIIDGEINNYDEMSAAKQNLKDDVLKTLKECESIEEYLKSIDSSVKL